MHVQAQALTLVRVHQANIHDFGDLQGTFFFTEVDYLTVDMIANDIII